MVRAGGYTMTAASALADIKLTTSGLRILGVLRVTPSCLLVCNNLAMFTKPQLLPFVALATLETWGTLCDTIHHGRFADLCSQHHGEVMLEVDPTIPPSYPRSIDFDAIPLRLTTFRPDLEAALQDPEAITAFTKISDLVAAGGDMTTIDHALRAIGCG